MLKIGLEEYTEEELRDIIQLYEQSKGKYIKPYFSQLPRETKEHIIQQLPYYHAIINKPYENINIYQQKYCQLPISKEMIIRYIKLHQSKYDYYHIFMFIVKSNYFMVYDIIVNNRKITKLIIYTIVKGLTRFTYSRDIIEKPTFNDLDFINFNDVIIDIKNTESILNIYQCSKYVNIRRMLKIQIRNHFKIPIGTMHIDELFENVKTNIYFHLSSNKPPDYILERYPLIEALFDDDGFFLAWIEENDGEDEVDWFDADDIQRPIYWFD
jgi:hypothetical protein